MAEPVYLTKQDYYDFSGIDLQLELKGSNYDNISDMVDIFLYRVEEWCKDYLQMKYMITPESENFDVVAFKKGLLHQIDYLRKNGDLSIQAVNASPKLAHNALMAWKNAGMCNVALHNDYVVDPWI